MAYKRPYNRFGKKRGGYGKKKPVKKIIIIYGGSRKYRPRRRK